MPNIPTGIFILCYSFMVYFYTTPPFKIYLLLLVSYIIKGIIMITNKGGLIGGMLACGPRDFSLNPAQGKFVWTNFLNHKL